MTDWQAGERARYTSPSGDTCEVLVLGVMPKDYPGNYSGTEMVQVRGDGDVLGVDYVPADRLTRLKERAHD